MKLIIDIDEDEYKRMKDESIYSTHTMICAIQNGIPFDSFPDREKGECKERSKPMSKEEFQLGDTVKCVGDTFNKGAIGIVSKVAVDYIEVKFNDREKYGYPYSYLEKIDLERKGE